jgi:hypothetical protein
VPIRFILSLCLMTMFVAESVAADLPPAPEGTFSIVVIPDTQGYRGEKTKAEPNSATPLRNSVFEAHSKWIAANISSQRVVFVSHVGDIVDKNNDAQWALAQANMDRVHGKVPYGIVVGNHDMTFKGNSALFQKYFPASRFADFDWYGGFFEGDPERPAHSGNNANSYQLISAEGVDLIMLHLECNAPDNVVVWANALLTKHADRKAIISTHMDLGPLKKPKTSAGYMSDPKGRMQWLKCHKERGNTPEQLWEKLYRKHANLIMVCSGDQSRTSALYLPREGDHGNVVHGLLSDYTSSGPLRVYRFSPAIDQIKVITYDTTRKALVDSSKHVSGRENHQFVIGVDF